MASALSRLRRTLSIHELGTFDIRCAATRTGKGYSCALHDGASADSIIAFLYALDNNSMEEVYNTRLVIWFKNGSYAYITEDYDFIDFDGMYLWEIISPLVMPEECLQKSKPIGDGNYLESS